MPTSLFGNKLLDKVFKGTDFAPPEEIYLGLLLALPTTENPNGAEVSRTNSGYNRIPILAKMGPVANNSIANTELLRYNISQVRWGNIVALGLFDSLVDGSLLDVLVLPTAVFVDRLRIIKWQPSEFVVSWGTEGRLSDGYWQNGQLNPVLAGRWYDGVLVERIWDSADFLPPYSSSVTYEPQDSVVFDSTLEEV